MEQKADKKRVEVTRVPAHSDPGFVYSSPEVKDYDYSDFINVNSSVRGVLLSFGKVHPRSKEPIVHYEVLVPLDVAASLGTILKNALADLAEKGVIKTQEKPKGSK